MNIDEKLNGAFEEMMGYRQSIGYATTTYRSSVPPFISFCVAVCQGRCQQKLRFSTCGLIPRLSDNRKVNAFVHRISPTDSGEHYGRTQSIRITYGGSLRGVLRDFLYIHASPLSCTYINPA